MICSSVHDTRLVFLIILVHPFLEKLNRIKTKYGIFDQ